MNTTNNGGPAFPAGSVRKSRPAHDAGGDWVETDRVQPLHQGLTTRDYFAAKAMQAYITSQIDMTRDDVSLFAEENVAKISYQFADAMLRARGES